MRWEEGRQRTGYRRLKLGEGKYWDLYLLDYPRGTWSPVHTDPIPGYKHWRFNIVIWGKQAYRGDHLFRLGPIVFFRPDEMPHSVGHIDRWRLVLSFSWITRNKDRPDFRGWSG